MILIQLWKNPKFEKEDGGISYRVTIVATFDDVENLNRDLLEMLESSWEIQIL